MPTSNKKSVAKLIAMTLGVFALLLVAAVGIPVLMSQLAPSVLPSFEGPAKRAELEMEIAERAFEAEAPAESPPPKSEQQTLDGSLTPVQLPPIIGVTVLDAEAGILALTLSSPEFAPGVIRFDPGQDSIAISFPSTGETRTVPLTDFFAAGEWTLTPGAESTQHRTTIPPGYQGVVLIVFTHASADGARSQVSQRLEIE